MPEALACVRQLPSLTPSSSLGGHRLQQAPLLLAKASPACGGSARRPDVCAAPVLAVGRARMRQQQQHAQSRPSRAACRAWGCSCSRLCLSTRPSMAGAQRVLTPRLQPAACPDPSMQSADSFLPCHADPPAPACCLLAQPTRDEGARSCAEVLHSAEGAAGWARSPWQHASWQHRPHLMPAADAEAVAPRLLLFSSAAGQEHHGTHHQAADVDAEAAQRAGSQGDQAHALHQAPHAA